ncbi:MAG: gluconate transporter [Henriciella sp.]|nr:gluconate transporter [Henriciella sp.]MBO6696380.1 gluconate transporter [Henriciella sp.]
MDQSDPIYIVATLAASVAGLLLLVIRAKVPAFFALILVSLIAGLVLGLDPAAVVASIQNGMAGVLGFIAVVVGLGAILGAVLEQSGGVKALSDRLAHGSVKSVPTKMSFLGLLVAIPVFFDVALVILMPMVKRLATTIRRKPLFVAAPLLAGLAAAHAFIPPTPGPIAVAALLDADLGLVILAGLIAAVPAILCGGVLFARRQYDHPVEVVGEAAEIAAPQPATSLNFLAAFLALAFPIVLVASGTVLKMTLGEEQVPGMMLFLSHPFVALLLTVGLYYTFAATQLKLPANTLNQAAMKSLEPAGAVVLVTGAGGAFKQVLIDSQAGARIAELAASANVSVLVFAFMIAGLVRVIQGSATVAMITAAGFTAPLLAISGISEFDRALAVISIAAGATILSHVNDSGFWLVSKYLDLSVNETLKSWTVVSTIVGGVGFVTALILSLIF